MLKNTTPKKKWYDDYKKQYDRVMQAHRRALKMGYQPDPEHKLPVAPSQMQTIRKRDVERLEKLTPAEIRKRMLYVTPFGEGLSNIDIVQKERETRSIKKERKKRKLEPLPEESYEPSFADITIASVRNTLAMFPNAEGARILNEWLDNVLVEYGTWATARMLDEGYSEGNIITYNLVYKGGVQTFINNMMAYLPGFSDTMKSNMADLLEQAESWEGPV